MEIFSSEKISPHVTRITECTGTHMYLAEGDDKALLIDTGCGVGNLKEYVEQLTKKPFDCRVHTRAYGSCRRGRSVSRSVFEQLRIGNCH